MEMRSQRLVTRAGIVRLRPLQRSDMSDWREARLGDENVLRGVEPTEPVDWVESNSPRAFKRMMRRARSAEVDGLAATAAIELDGRLVGQMTLGGMRPFPVATCWAGYWVHSAQWGGGVATAALALACDHARALGMHRIEATVLADNAASRRVLERCGFRPVGVAREAFHIDGAWRDHLLLDRVVGQGSAVEALVADGVVAKLSDDRGD
ncbi:GNAT family N-acetyltransferase [uncultured Corynebacterium sp.]|uniref:GNAT family N-acetyltransferase n=1 Tax=uncultured Corynebacterium sp. TaxID=159447 RepID=UPI0026006B66|nr:GNAT family protein [uncultured Corynebacterium sp.]